MYRNGFPAQHDEALGALHHEARKFVTQNTLDFVCLFDLDAHPYRVDGRLDQHALVLIARYCKGVEEYFF